MLPGSVVRRDSAIEFRNEHLATGSGKECLSAVLKDESWDEVFRLRIWKGCQGNIGLCPCYYRVYRRMRSL